jgi:hypothetical protein
MALRPALAVLVALVLAIGPTLGALAAGQAAGPHAAMEMSHDGGDDGCCDHSDRDAGKACFAHCSAGVIDTSSAVMAAPAATDCAVSNAVRLSASHAPVPDTAPPKSSAV